MYAPLAMEGLHDGCVHSGTRFSQKEGDEGRRERNGGRREREEGQREKEEGMKE